MPIENRGDTLAKIFRWTARVISTLVIIFGLFMLVGSAGFDDTGPDLGIVIFTIFMIGTMIALILAWRWEKKGGMVALVGSICMGVSVFFTAGSNQLIAGILIPSPFTVSAILYLLSWWRTDPRSEKDD